MTVTAQGSDAKRYISLSGLSLCLDPRGHRGSSCANVPSEHDKPNIDKAEDRQRGDRTTREIGGSLECWQDERRSICREAVLFALPLCRAGGPVPAIRLFYSELSDTANEGKKRKKKSTRPHKAGRLPSAVVGALGPGKGDNSTLAGRSYDL